MNPIQGIYSICDITYSHHQRERDLAQELLAGGVSILQLRMKNTPNIQKIRNEARAILELKTQYDFCFIINDYVEIAQELPVDGIHLGQDDLSLLSARKIFGEEFLIGYSSHSYDEALQAANQGASYVALGAIFPTRTKGPGHPVLGLEILKKVVQSLHVPVVAIGGIQIHHLVELAATGVNAIAIITALSRAQDVTQATRDMIQQWEKCLKL